MQMAPMERNKEIMNIIDLHVHSLVSDGSYSPRELAHHAKEVGLSAFALTDHDNIAGNGEAAAAAREQGLDFLNGMELTADFMGRKLHIVCLGFDADHPSFRQLYAEIRRVKEGKIPEIIDYVRAKGIDISLEKVRPFAYGEVLDRYAIMRYLVSLHLYDRAQPLWDHYLDPAVRELGLDQNMPVEEALPVIHEAGGVTSLAHFHKKIGLKGLSRAEQEAAIARLHAMGLDGMERWYPNYTQEDSDFAAHMIEKYHLLTTGGTDFHGSNRPQIEMGHGIAGNMAIPYEVYTKIILSCKKFRDGKQENGGSIAN